ncbi:MAG: serine hydroxymethyltransferase, partial [Planctomycetia bacterium]|nr:serine hydroxymethyltransferase [Planctomycetia bacterium]
MNAPLKDADPEVQAVIDEEELRQAETIELIASENHASRAVLEAAGSALTDKYAEGYPGERYYGGCDVIDKVENLAIERGKKLFGCEHINVQPHSGSQANLAVFYAALDAGDMVLSMNLAHGGHLSHGMVHNFSGRFYRIVHYGVCRDTELIDYDGAAALAKEHKPRLIIAGGSSYPRAVDVVRMAEIADDARAHLMVDMAHFGGLVAAKLNPDPVPVADFVTGTTHKTLRGTRGGYILCKKQFAGAIDSAIFPGIQGGPLMHIIAAKAVTFGLALRPEFVAYQKQILANARAMADEFAGLGYRVVSGGTDTHLLLLDLTKKGVTGADAQTLLQSAGIIVNKNLIPFDTKGPKETSGIRIGTPAITTRAADEQDCRQVARWIDDVLSADEPRKAGERVRGEVEHF